MKHYPNRPLLAAALVLAVMVSGCTELRGRQDSDNSAAASSPRIEEQVNGAVNGIGEEVNRAVTDMSRQIGDTVGSVGEQVNGAVSGIGSAVAQQVGQLADTAAGGVAHSLDDASGSRTVSAELQAAKGDTLVLANPVGNIEVRQDTGDTIRVQATVRVYDLGGSELQNQILDEAKVSIKRKGDRFTVSAVSGSGEDIWKWARKKVGSDKISIVYSVTVPKSMTRFELSTDVGNLDVSGVSGRFKLFSDVGLVQLSGARVEGPSSLDTDTGTISLDVVSLADDASLSATADVGAIHASFAPELAFTLKTDSEVGAISGARKGTDKINGGGPTVTLISSVGAISVER